MGDLAPDRQSRLSSGAALQPVRKTRDQFCARGAVDDQVARPCQTFGIANVGQEACNPRRVAGVELAIRLPAQQVPFCTEASFDASFDALRHTLGTVPFPDRPDGAPRSSPPARRTRAACPISAMS